MEPLPHGKPEACPMCMAALSMDRDVPFEMTQCPRCSVTLWAFAFTHGPMFFVRRPSDRLGDFLFSFGLSCSDQASSPDDIELIFANADSVDLVELILDVEETMRLRASGAG